MPTGPAGRRRDRLVEQLDDFAGAGERSARAPADDLGGYPAREPLLAEFTQDARLMRASDFSS